MREGYLDTEIKVKVQECWGGRMAGLTLATDRENIFCCFKPPSLLNFVTAVQGTNTAAQGLTHTAIQGTDTQLPGE